MNNQYLIDSLEKGLILLGLRAREWREARMKLIKTIEYHCKSCQSNVEIKEHDYIDATCPVCGDPGLEKVREK